MRIDNYIYITLIFFLGIISNRAYSQDYPYDIDQYEFINYDQNRFIYYGDSLFFENFFNKFNKIIFQGTGQINIVHLGGSHIQADIFSGRVRERLQSFYPGLKGGRGFIFPYKIAETNNPYNYYAEYTGEWISCKITKRDEVCSLGLSGITLTTYDSVSSIKFVLKNKNYPYYDFNRVKIFHDIDRASFRIDIDDKLVNPIRVINYSGGYTMFLLDKYIDTLRLKIVKTGYEQERFVLYGISLETDDPGLFYHAIGVNGATVASFLRCNLFGKHLGGLKPDLVVLSLGINDAYSTGFDPMVYEYNYDILINRIRDVAPNSAILFTVNNDSYYRRRYVNRNVIEVRETMIRLAKKHNCGVWDLHEVMGGMNSILTWNILGLAKNDKIHFTRKGYELVGDLFFNAFLKSYENYITSNTKTKQKDK